MIERALGNDLKGKVIVIIGKSYKTGTNDTTHSPTIEIAEKLEQKGAHIKIYNSPQLSDGAKDLSNVPTLRVCESVCKNAHAVVVGCQMPEYHKVDQPTADDSAHASTMFHKTSDAATLGRRAWDWGRMHDAMQSSAVVVDLTGRLDVSSLRDIGLRIYQIGESPRYG